MAGDEDPPGRAAPSGPDSPPALDAASSRRTMPMTPATPDAAEEESEVEYFPPLRAPSRSSSIVAGSDTIRPARDQARHPSIRIRRGSNLSLYQQASAPDGSPAPEPTRSNAQQRNRPRSISQPTSSMPAYPDASIARHSRRVPQMMLPRLTEEGARPTTTDMNAAQSPISPTRSLPEETLAGARLRPSSAGSEPTKKLNRKRRLSRLLWPGSSTRPSQQPPQPPTRSDEFDEELVDWLDIVDPEVQTLSTLTNVQNSLFVPDLGSWVNRRPTYVLSQYGLELRPPVPRPERPAPEVPFPEEEPQETPIGAQPEPAETGRRVALRRSDTITSRLTESHYAALPHGITLQGWSAEEKLELDDHVRHMLHSRRSRFKRMMKGFGQYVRRPLGFFVTLYATLITLFGLAWVLFLIGWIYVGDKQVYTIHIIDSVLVALFAVMGDGLAPFRAVDTYHMIFVVHYSRMIAKAKKKKKNKRQGRSRRSSLVSQLEGAQSVELTQTGGASSEGLAPHISEALGSRNTRASTERIAASTSNTGRELRAISQNFDIEGAKLDVEYDEDSPLTYKQWKCLRHHQKKLARSHSFYKPDETFTHNPFPLAYLIAIVILLDCHSCLQISLGATTWGIDYHHRPIVITTVILCVSITCNLTAGLVIMIGDRKTRKKEVKELLDRQELTGDAIRHLENKRAKEQSRSHDSTEESQQKGGLIEEM